MSRLLIANILLIITITLSQPSTEAAKNVTFDKMYFGVVFEPYTKFFADKNDYTMKEVENMLKVVSKRFQRISTYGMGTLNPTGKWNESHATGLSAVAASQVNNQMQRLALIVNIGTYWNPTDDRIVQQEISNAFEAADVANKIFNNTVQGIIMKEDTQGQEQNLVQYLKSYSNNTSLKLGVRSSVCQQLMGNPSAEELLELLDFIICHKNPTSFQNVSKEVELVGNYFLQSRDSFSFRNVQVIGQTHWPSFHKEGKKFYSNDAVQFWIQMGEWAQKNKFLVDMLEAFDEPWKGVEIKPEEGHAGWWKRIKNDTTDETAFAEKLDYIEIEPVDYHTMEIGIGILVAAGFLVMLCGMFVLYKKLALVKNQLLTKADIVAFEKGVPSDQIGDNMEDALRLPYDKSYEIARANLLIDRSHLLGSGAFGCVYLGKIQGMADNVALKTTNANCSATSLKSLLSEIKIMIHVGKHPNVVGIIGAYTEELKKGVIMIATELCPRGSLEKYLRDQKIKLDEGEASLYQNVTGDVRYVNLPMTRPHTENNLMENLLKWSYEIACGMAHISSRNVIHADLATRNVLLSVNGSAKITDFGLSRRMYEYTNYVKQNQEPLPWRWMAVESLQSMIFSTKSDVWSYGVTIWEIFALGSVPFPGLSWTVDFADNLAKGLRMKKPTYATEEIYAIMSDCWKPSPKDRPDFSSLASAFHGLVHESNYLDTDQDTDMNDQNLPLIN